MERMEEGAEGRQEGKDPVERVGAAEGGYLCFSAGCQVQEQ